MKKLALIVVVLIATLPFNKWLKMTPPEQGRYIDSLHQQFHKDNPNCKISGMIGIPVLKKRRFWFDKTVMEFYIECIQEVDAYGKEHRDYEKVRCVHLGYG